MKCSFTQKNIKLTHFLEIATSFIMSLEFLWKLIDKRFLLNKTNVNVQQFYEKP